MSHLTRRGLLKSTLAVGTAAALPACARAVQSPEGRDPVVHTSNGPVRGKAEDGVLVFRGLRYAAPPIGALRFKSPHKPTPWSDIADASQFGAAAIQAP